MTAVQVIESIDSISIHPIRSTAWGTTLTRLASSYLEAPHCQSNRARALKSPSSSRSLSYKHHHHPLSVTHHHRHHHRPLPTQLHFPPRGIMHPLLLDDGIDSSIPPPSIRRHTAQERERQGHGAARLSEREASRAALRIVHLLGAGAAADSSKQHVCREHRRHRSSWRCVCGVWYASMSTCISFCLLQADPCIFVLAVRPYPDQPSPIR
jgi:hypothetical protein